MAGPRASPTFRAIVRFTTPIFAITFQMFSKTRGCEECIRIYVCTSFAFLGRDKAIGSQDVFLIISRGFKRNSLLSRRSRDQRVYLGNMNHATKFSDYNMFEHDISTIVSSNSIGKLSLWHLNFRLVLTRVGDHLAILRLPAVLKLGSRERLMCESSRANFSFSHGSCARTTARTSPIHMSNTHEYIDFRGLPKCSRCEQCPETCVVGKCSIRRLLNQIRDTLVA